RGEAVGMSKIDQLKDFAGTPFGIMLNPSAALTLQTTPEPVLIAGAAMFAGAIAGGGMIGAIVAAATFAIITRLNNRGDPNLAQAVGARLQNIRSPSSPWRFVYGQVRVGGVISFLEANSALRHIHAIITIAAHECEELGEIW